MAKGIIETLTQRLHHPLPRMRTTLFGDDFIWRNPGPDCQDVVERGMRRVAEAVLRRTADAIRRQKRDTVASWDAMTCVAADNGFVPARLREGREYELALELVASLGKGMLEARHGALIADLGELD